MPRQETFFSHDSGNLKIEVIKSYDPHYAREVFDVMVGDATEFLVGTLNLDTRFDPADMPHPTDVDYDSTIWGLVLEDADEDGCKSSFFVVSKDSGLGTEDLYVSPDWPSAKAFAEKLISA